MLAFDADPVLREARALADERRRVRRALAAAAGQAEAAEHRADLEAVEARLSTILGDADSRELVEDALDEIGRASCRERVCMFV